MDKTGRGREVAGVMMLSLGVWCQTQQVRWQTWGGGDKRLSNGTDSHVWFDTVEDRMVKKRHTVIHWKDIATEPTAVGVENAGVRGERENRCVCGGVTAVVSCGWGVSPGGRVEH